MVSFNCPSCGSPNTYSGAATTTTCTACGAAVTVPGSSGLPTSLNEELRTLLAARKKIEAIKRYREVTGLGLKEAKEAVEAFEMGQPLPPVAVSPHVQPSLATVQALAAQGKKIEAIKRYRELTGVGLAEAKNAVEAMETAGGDNLAPPRPETAFLAEVAELAQKGQKIEAVKRYRQLTNVGLKEAKDAVEAFEQSGRWGTLPLAVPNTQPTLGHDSGNHSGSGGNPLALLAGVSVALCLLFGGAIFFLFQAETANLTNQLTQVPFPTLSGVALEETSVAVLRATEEVRPATPIPTASPEPTIDIVATTAAEAANLQAAAAALLAAQAAWPVVVSDTFTANTFNWPAKTVQDSSIIIQPQLANGEYTWNVAPKHGGVYENLLPDPAGEYADFSAAVDIRFPLGDASPEYTYGLVVRHVDNDYALCGIQPDGSFRLLIVYDSGFSTLIASDTEAIRQEPNAVNRVAIISQGDHFVCLVNDVPVWAWEELMAPGGIGLGVDVESNAGAGEVVFDNFEIRAP